MTLTRRAVLHAGLLTAIPVGTALLAACSPSTQPTQTATPSTPTPAPSFASPTPTPSPVNTVGLPDAVIEDVITRFSTHTPTAWGMDIDGIVTRSTGSEVVLTLDACGGPHGSGVDLKLLEFLEDKRIQTTLFLNQRWIEANPVLAHDLAEEPLFELANHGTRHCPLCVDGREAYGIAGTKNAAQATYEVADNHRTLTELTGIEPRLFRSGTAHYDDVGVAICRALGEIPVGFDVNADGGATFTVDQILTATAEVREGSVIIAHMNQPRADTGTGLIEAIPRLLDSGFSFSHLKP